jgi:hypothetical protein
MVREARQYLWMEFVLPSVVVSVGISGGLELQYSYRKGHLAGQLLPPLSNFFFYCTLSGTVTPQGTRGLVRLSASPASRESQPLGSGARSAWQ